MNFEDLQRVNATIKTMPISRKDKKTGQTVSKDYAVVNERIKAFRMLYPEGSITTDMLSNDGEICVFKAVISNGEVILGTGTAFESKKASFINETSYIENCETSAVGRALAMCGIGIDVSVASYEEVANAIKNQDDTKPAKGEPKKTVAVEEAELKAKVLAYINKVQMKPDSIHKLCAHYKVNSINMLTADNCRDYIANLEKQGVNIDE